MKTIHEPVLLSEVLEYLKPEANQNFVDCTFGGGGHSLAMLEKVKPNGKVIGIDLDPKTVEEFKKPKNLILVHDNYRNLDQIIKKVKNDLGLFNINGVLLDLGLSSDQLGAEHRGFSFQNEGFLDLRFDETEDRPTAAEILRTYNEGDLFKIFAQYGDEPLARPIAKKIIADRLNGINIETAEMLVQLVSEIYRTKFKSVSRKNPATRIFQALRIAVNDEFGNLKSVLPKAIECLAPGGRLAVISFHSGEDRIVKNFFRDWSKKDEPPFKLVTRKPVAPSAEEIKRNPRSRSSKLRVVEKL